MPEAVAHIDFREKASFDRPEIFNEDVEGGELTGQTASGHGIAGGRCPLERLPVLLVQQGGADALGVRLGGHARGGDQLAA